MIAREVREEQEERGEVNRVGKLVDFKFSLAIISPGLFSVPPIIGSSVEHDIEMVSRVLSRQYNVIVYTRKCAQYPRSSKHGQLIYQRFRYRNPRQYLTHVLRDLEKRQPDLIQVENRPHFVPYLKRKFPQIPIILNMHSMQFASPPWISVLKVEKAMGQIDALLTNSQYLRQEYIDQFPCLKEKSFAVHLGIEIPPFFQAQFQPKKVKRWRKKFRLKQQDKVLLFVGRVNRNKGAHHLLQALPHIISKDKNVKLLIVGSPRYGHVKATSYLSRLKAKARVWKKKVIFTGFIKPVQMPYIYQLADVVVTPSVWQEPFCRVNLEAMSAAKPVVTTRRGGIPEVVQDRKNGYVLPLQTLRSSLPTTLLKLLADKEERDRLGLAALRRATLFSWEKTARGYLQVYNKLLEI